jgi:hypothetical protein
MPKDDAPPAVQLTRFGFRWGKIDIVRACQDPRAGKVIHIHTGKQVVAIRVTPSGVIRVGEIGKDWQRD